MPAQRALPVIKRSRLVELIHEADAVWRRGFNHPDFSADDVVEAMRGRSFVCAGPSAPLPNDPATKVLCPIEAHGAADQTWGGYFDTLLYDQFKNDPWWHMGPGRGERTYLVVRIEEDV